MMPSISNLPSLRIRFQLREELRVGGGEGVGV
jgi:hypothetical protein